MIGPNHDRNVARKARRRAEKSASQSRESFASTADAVPAVDHVPKSRELYLEEILKRLWSLGSTGEIPLSTLLIEVYKRRNFDFFNTTLGLEDKLTPEEIDTVVLALHHRARRKIRSEGGRVTLY